MRPRPRCRTSPASRSAYNYFSQTLLPDYIEQNGLDWDVVYDARGNFHEPHAQNDRAARHAAGAQLSRRGRHAGARRDAADRAQRRFPTVGPRNRFGAILFIEKEGFEPLLDAAQIAERFDIAIMSTKGMSVTASRRLVEKLCAPHDIPLLVLHDFDVSGFTIAGTLAIVDPLRIQEQ